MGLFYDRRVGFPVTLNVNFDEAMLPPLRCTKTAIDMVRDFVERCPGIARLVAYNGSSGGLNGSPTDEQLTLLVEDPSDAAAMVGGMPLEWLDCCTKFLDLTPVGAASGRYILRMLVLPPGSLSGFAVQASLLV
jgi:hypothetical protein